VDHVGLIAHFTGVHCGLTGIIFDSVYNDAVFPVLHTDPCFSRPSRGADKVGCVHVFSTIPLVIDTQVLDVGHDVRAVKVNVLYP
jgi:hypothetical protein